MGVTQRQTKQLQPRRLPERVPGSFLLQQLQTFPSTSQTPRTTVKMAVSKIRQNYHGFAEHFKKESGEEGSSSRTLPNPPPWIGGLRLKPWKLRLSSRRRSTRAFSTCTRGPEIRATDISATSLSPSTWQSRWRASRLSAT